MLATTLKKVVNAQEMQVLSIRSVMENCECALNFVRCELEY